MIRGLLPNWPIADKVHGFSSQRSGGVSVAPYGSLNLGAHVHDLPAAVKTNRKRLTRYLKLPKQPCWLNQVHGNGVIRISENGCKDIPEGDAAYTDCANTPLVIMTADCLPVLLASEDGQELAAVHCGWRSLASNILEHALAEFKSPKNKIHAWLGPAIGPNAFEVGEDVRTAMLSLHSDLAHAFRPYGAKYLADIYAIATQQLQLHGVQSVSGGGECTYNQPLDYFSFRRDGKTGRMATLIWRT
ncbi:peptidoglycan editing factor PgeF [Aliidiomarina shirensis]|uniref:Purine nucleoside phosphorylase n=1 Tax=Aliidiomarina shirensis TaxID=1048642 RepID=A0A432WQJ0_9GAMM|nr:peptidoglycan editing factor PgeF [Aliidiomarina shirensis]RUO36066.1 peptidoglycan editing factor PgeF [Aliidiomarina shirensis]